MRISVVLAAVLLCACGDGTAVKETLVCSSPVRGDQQIAFTMERWDFADGSVMSHCTLADGAASYDSTEFYPHDVNGVESAQCLVAYDLDTSTYGFWRFTLSKGGTTATAQYFDSGSVYDGHTVALICTPHVVR